MTIAEYFENNEKLSLDNNPELRQILEDFVKYLQGENEKFNQEQNKE